MNKLLILCSVFVFCFILTSAINAQTGKSIGGAKVTQQGNDAECSFGNNVSADGIYKKSVAKSRNSTQISRLSQKRFFAFAARRVFN